MGVLSVRLPDDLTERLNTLAKVTGRKKSFYVQQAIAEQLEDLEDLYLAEKTLENIRAGKDEFISYDEFFKELEG